MMYVYVMGIIGLPIVFGAMVTVAAMQTRESDRFKLHDTFGRVRAMAGRGLDSVKSFDSASFKTSFRVRAVEVKARLSQTLSHTFSPSKRRSSAFSVEGTKVADESGFYPPALTSNEFHFQGLDDMQVESP
jgi:hypothetical protein